MSRGERFDIYQAITDQIVAMVEDGAGDYRMPWHMAQGDLMRPENIDSRQPYQGVNILALWVSSQINGFTSPVWGTFKQWQAAGCQVRKGARATYGVIYKDRVIANDQGSPDEAPQHRPFARAFPLFNADQVEGYQPLLLDPLNESSITPIEEAERFIAATGAVFIEGGDQAFYRPSTDTIHMPSRDSFTGTTHRSPREAWYGVRLHELIHWTGARHRLDRDLTGRFATNAYAMEELVAELGAAFLCADLDISVEPRRDHAQYVANWLQVLRNDKKAIFTAASRAQAAARYTHEHGWVKQARARLEAIIAAREAETDGAPRPAHPADDLPLFVGNRRRHEPR
jgi:antirestriction protein ArdC